MSYEQELLDKINDSFCSLAKEHGFVLKSFDYNEGCFGNFIATFTSNKIPKNKYGIIIQIILDRNQIFINLCSVKKPKIQYDLFQLLKLINSQNNGNRISLAETNYWDKDLTIAGQMMLAARQLNSVIIPVQDLFCKKNYRQTTRKMKLILRQYRMEMKSMYNDMELAYRNKQK